MQTLLVLQLHHLVRAGQQYAAVRINRTQRCAGGAFAADVQRRDPRWKCRLAGTWGARGLATDSLHVIQSTLSQCTMTLADPEFSPYTTRSTCSALSEKTSLEARPESASTLVLPLSALARL